MKDLSSVRLSDLLKEVKTTEEEIWGDLKIETKMYLKNIIEKCLLEEQTKIIGAYRNQRNMIRVDYRNGYYKRSLETSYGTVENLQVPRNRLRPIESRVFKKYQRKEVSLKNLIKDCFLAGVSTRRVGEVLEEVIGYKPSAQTVSNISKELDLMVKKFHSHSLSDTCRFIFFDAINLRVKNLENKNKKTVLVAYGISTSGKREIIDFMIAKSESELSWYMFVDSLYRRGAKRFLP